MSVEKIKEYYAKKGYEHHIHMFMALQCGPLLKGMVNTRLVSVDNRMEKALLHAIKATKFSCMVFYRGDKRCLIFIYERNNLKSHLGQKRILSELSRYGYYTEGFCENPSGLERICRQLVKRIEEYYQGKREFPHEIGYFLEYPLEDVQLFIENKGKNYLISGYWKVYTDAENAQNLFRLYDMAREEAVEEILNGRKFYEIVA